MSFSVDKLPYGANFAVRGEVQRANLFDPELGRRADAVLGEDELDLMRRLLAAGFHGRWVPGAVVEHLIPMDRTTTQYVYDYFVGQGRNLVLKGRGWGTDADQLKREANAEYRRFWWKRFYAGNQQWCSHLIRSGLAMGQSRAIVDFAGKLELLRLEGLLDTPSRICHLGCSSKFSVVADVARLQDSLLNLPNSSESDYPKHILAGTELIGQRLKYVKLIFDNNDSQRRISNQ